MNADNLARELEVNAYEAAEVAKQLREVLLAQGESFVFETVFSDPVRDKLELLRRASARRYAVVLCFIGLDSRKRCDERVAMRVLQGGHDVPTEKLVARYPPGRSRISPARSANCRTCSCSTIATSSSRFGRSPSSSSVSPSR